MLCTCYYRHSGRKTTVSSRPTWTTWAQQWISEQPELLKQTDPVSNNNKKIKTHKQKKWKNGQEKKEYTYKLQWFRDTEKHKGKMTHTLNTKALGGRGRGISMSLKPAWPTKQAAGQPDLLSSHPSTFQFPTLPGHLRIRCLASCLTWSSSEVESS